jgi:hypothetical protein
MVGNFAPADVQYTYIGLSKVYHESMCCLSLRQCLYGTILYHGKISNRDFRIFKARIVVSELDTLCIEIHDCPARWIRHLLKRKMRRLLEKSARPPCCEKAFKDYSPSCTAIGN